LILGNYQVFLLIPVEQKLIQEKENRSIDAVKISRDMTQGSGARKRTKTPQLSCHGRMAVRLNTQILQI
jgi:hypothetical protein